MASLLISVLDRKLAPTVGPLLHTLVRLCVDPIDPSRDVAVRVLFDWRCYDYDDDNDDNNDNHDDGNEWGEKGIGCRHHLRRRRIRIRLKKTAIMISSAGVKNVFVNNVIVFVSVASVSPGTYPTTFI